VGVSMTSSESNRNNRIFFMRGSPFFSDPVLLARRASF
jgi:hypothetical protein